MRVCQLFFCLTLVVTTSSAVAQEEYRFAFPPRDVAAKARETYEPIAELLSRATGKRFVLRHYDNWLSYQMEMKADAHDFVFDAPVFVGWRATKFGHVPLAKLQGEITFSVIVKKDNKRVQQMNDLAGRKICAFPPPNMATLFLFDQFRNPARQPSLMHINNFIDAYKGLLASRCQAAVLPTMMVQMLDPENNNTRAIFKSVSYPNPGFSASTRIPPEMRKKIVAALLSPEGATATATLRAEFGGRDLVETTGKEYEGLGVLLRDTWGLEL